MAITASKQKTKKENQKQKKKPKKISKKNHELAGIMNYEIQNAGIPCIKIFQEKNLQGYLISL